MQTYSARLLRDSLLSPGPSDQLFHGSSLCAVTDPVVRRESELWTNVRYPPICVMMTSSPSLVALATTLCRNHLAGVILTIEFAKVE